MTNQYVAQAVATERIHQLSLEADHDRQGELARAGGIRTRPAARVARVWSWTASTPRRLHSFLLAGQLGHGYQPSCC
jgi:hypothetical protein